MKKRFFSAFLAVIMVFVSTDVTSFAAESANESFIQMQTEKIRIKNHDYLDQITSMIETEENISENLSEVERELSIEEQDKVEEETINESQDTLTTEEVKEDIGASTSVEITIEDTITEETEVQNASTTEKTTKEDTNVSTTMEEETEVQEASMIEEKEIEETTIEDTDSSTMDTLTTEEATIEDTETITSTIEEMETEQEGEEAVVGSSSELNTAMKNKILSFKSKYPEGKNWDPSGNGWRNLAWECYGFVITMEELIFKDYPVQKHLRSTANGKTVEGWTCYYVTSSNYNSLVVEPGDVLDCPTSTQWNHTAMVLSVDNGKITCVQANNGGNNYVYWTQCFNYNSRRSTLKNIYNDYSKYITGSGSKVFRLWKPSEELKKQATGFSDTPAESTLGISGQEYPQTIKQGSSWTCKGIISSNYTINQVGGYILGSDCNTILYSKIIHPNTSSYSLANGEIDKALLFNELAVGTYYYKITSRDTSGKSLTLIQTRFTVESPTPQPCDFIGDLKEVESWYDTNGLNVKLRISASDYYGINSFRIKCTGNESNRTENVTPSKSQDSYFYDYQTTFSENGTYFLIVDAVCGNGQTHRVGDYTIVYDRTAPVFKETHLYNWEMSNGNDEFVYSGIIDDNIEETDVWVIIRDEQGNEKRFEPEILDNSRNGGEFLGYWDDISGLSFDGVYTLTFYAQDRAGNIGSASEEVIISKLSASPEKIDLSVGESAEVAVSLESFFNVKEKGFSQSNDILQITENGLQAVVEGLKPGSRKFNFAWEGRNNVVSINKSCEIYAYVVPKTPKITKVSNNMEGYDVITYAPVPYAKTYELYRKQVGMENEYQLWEEFSDNRSHNIMVEHIDENKVYSYRLRAKAEQTTDAFTNEKYYPTSDFSNEVIGDASTWEEGSEEETSSEEESSGEEESSSTEESETQEESGEENIAEGLYISGLKTKVYTGSPIKQDIKLYYNRILLKEGIDYTLSYKNNINEGTAVLIIKAKGNLVGTVSRNFTIKPKEISDNDVVIEESVYTNDSNIHKQAPKVSYQGKRLKEKKDFEVTDYSTGDYRSTGIYTVKIKGIGNFKGSSDSAKIIIADKSKSINNVTLAKIPTQEYRYGEKVEISDEFIRVTLNKTMLQKDVDYTVSYANNLNPGNATLIVKGIGEYVGSKAFSFRIKRSPANITNRMVVNQSELTFAEITKGGAKPEPLLVSNGDTLVKGVDYTISYKNNKKVGANAWITIKGKGNYKGTLSLPFTVTTKSLESTDISIRVPDMPYTGRANKYQSKPIITDKDGKKLILNKDYTIDGYSAEGLSLGKWSNPENNTKITVTISGKGYYTGEATAVYYVKGMKFSTANIKISPKSYTGKEVKIGAQDISSATIKSGKIKKELVLGKDYEIVSYQNNIKKGTATVVFRGKGEYAGDKVVKFKIKSTNIIR